MTAILETSSIVGPWRGAKGGQPSQQTVTRTPDNLRNQDTVEFLLAFGEGPVWGFSNGLKSFYLGDTQLENEAGGFNYTDIETTIYPGVENPPVIDMKLGGSSQSNAVGVTLSSGIPAIRSTVGSNLDFLEVRVNFDQLYVENDSGVFNNSVTFQIEYKGRFDTVWTPFYENPITLTGKTTSRYLREFRKKVPRIAAGYDMRVTKISPDSAGGSNCVMGWESFQEIISDPTKVYPNTAILHFTGKATDQFSSLPQFKSIMKGLIVQIPSNYDPIAKTYDGIWDGTFVSGWTNNNALILNDIVMNERYGVKSYYKDVYLDKYDVYSAAQWCDEMVTDGNGGLHARYTFNAWLTDGMSGPDLIRYVAGTFNAIVFDDLNGTAYLKVDRDDQAVHLFVKENVTEEGFVYSYADTTTWYNDLTVSFRNPNLNWDVDRRRVFNQDLIDLYGRIPLDFAAIGCTNEREALRRGHYKLITATTETCFVKFSSNRRLEYVHPFDVILVADPDMGYGITGRFKDIIMGRSGATLRDPIYLEAGIAYTITVVLNNGTMFETPLVNVSTGYNTTLHFNALLPAEIVPDKTVFALSNGTTIGLPRPFRVMSVTENEGSPDSFTIEATCINRNKWYDSDNFTDSSPIQYSVLPSPFKPPGADSCGFMEKFIRKDRDFHLIISPTFPRATYKYYVNTHEFEVWSRPVGDTGPFVKRVVQFSDTIVNHPPGPHEFRILGISYLGMKSDITTVQSYVFTVRNPLDAPKDVDWVRINKKEVYWGYTLPPDDFDGFVVKYHNQAGRETWDDAIKAHEGVLSATSFYTDLIPPSARVIMVRAVDVFGVPSLNSAIIYRDLGDITHDNIVEDFDFGPTYPGVKSGCSLVSGELLADDTGNLMFTGNPTAFVYNGNLFYDAVYYDMYYYPQFTSTAEGDLVIELDFEGAGYELDIRELSNYDWRPVGNKPKLDPGAYELRLRIFGGPIRGEVHSFKVTVDVLDVEESIEDFTAPAASFRAPITKNYPNRIKTVSVTIQGGSGATAINWRLLDKDNINGPLIELLDASGTVVGGDIDIDIGGY